MGRAGMRLLVQDAFGRPFELAAPGRRIVSLVPSITETLFELGAADQVVGVTKFCTEPPDGVQTKTKVGGPKNPRLDIILDLAPDLVIANVEEKCEGHGLSVVVAKDGSFTVANLRNGHSKKYAAKKK